jgi:hypothetical protein
MSTLNIVDNVKLECTPTTPTPTITTTITTPTPTPTPTPEPLKWRCIIGLDLEPVCVQSVEGIYDTEEECLANCPTQTPTPTPTPYASCSDCLKDCTARYNGELATSACTEGDPGQFWVWQEGEIEYSIYLSPGRTYGYPELGCDVACYSRAYHIATGATRTFQWSMTENYDANGCLLSLTVDGEGTEVEGGGPCGGGIYSGWDACVNGSEDYDCSTLTPPTPSGIVYTCVDISTPTP